MKLLKQINGDGYYLIKDKFGTWYLGQLTGTPTEDIEAEELAAWLRGFYSGLINLTNLDRLPQGLPISLMDSAIKMSDVELSYLDSDAYTPEERNFLKTTPAKLDFPTFLRDLNKGIFENKGNCTPEILLEILKKIHKDTLELMETTPAAQG
jgi:hypothetical protein